MKRWEYLNCTREALEFEHGGLGTVGNYGWELVAVVASKHFYDAEFFFKRELPRAQASKEA